MRDRATLIGIVVAAALILYVLLPVVLVDALAIGSLRTPGLRPSTEHELTALVVASLWPVLLGVAAWYFRAPLRALAARGTATDVTAVETLTRERALTTTAHLVAAQRSPATADPRTIGLLETQAMRAVDPHGAPPPLAPAEIAALVGALVTPATLRSFEGRSLLWLDTDPTAHVELIRAFEALAIRVDTALSTEDAMVKLELRRYDLLVADERRADNDRAGLPFTHAVRRRDATIPIVAPAGGPVRLFETLARQLLATRPLSPPR